MALLYRSDLAFLGYEVHPERIKRKRVLSSVYSAEMVRDNKVIPCVATFYRFRNAVKVDYIIDNETQKQVFDELLTSVRRNMTQYKKYILRNIVFNTILLCGIASFLIMLYTAFTIWDGLTLTEFNRIYNSFMCLMLFRLENYFISII